MGLRLPTLSQDSHQGVSHNTIGVIQVPARQMDLLLLAKGRRPTTKKRQPMAWKKTAPPAARLSLDGLLDHYLVLLLFLTLVCLSLPSPGRAQLIGVLGLLLCTAGLSHGEVKVDLWFLVPLIAYQIFCILSCFMNWHIISAGAAGGFLATQALYTAAYLLIARLDSGERLWLRRLCVLWAGCVSSVGVVQFLLRALSGRAARLGGVFGAPNALGIFLVISWFALETCAQEESGSLAWLVRLEPLLLTALALTLSMGSFVSMAAGILFLALWQLRHSSWRQALAFTCNLLARASFGVGLGVLMYVAARRSGQPWLCLLLTLYLLAVIFFWNRFRSFLADFPWAAAGMTVLGVLVAGGAILIRPSAVSTFLERLAMMENGVGYLTVRPLWGLGYLQWRSWNLSDSDIYFNTYHIHNVIIHIGVEFGIPAMVMAGAAGLRRFWKKTDPSSTAGFTAFALHSLIDTSFFFPSIPTFTLITAAEPGAGGKHLPALVTRLLFGVLALVLLASLAGSLGYL